MGRSRNDIERYLNGEMTPTEMHALEREALNDPFLAEALEGIDQAGTDAFLFDLKQLNKSVRQRTSLSKPKVISMWNWSIGIAAGLILMALCSVYIISIIDGDHKRELAARKELDSAASPAKVQSPAKDTLTTKEPAVEKRDDLIASKSTKPRPAATSSADDRAPAETVTRREAEGELAQSQPVEPIIADVKPANNDGAGAVKPTAPAVEKELARTGAEELERSRKQPAAVKAEIDGFAAGRIARGRVIAAEDQQGLPGVNVVIKGTNLGTVTDAEGNFEILLPQGDETLVLSFIGLQSTEVQANTTAPINVRMENDLAQLSEVVVTGYGLSKDDAREFDTFEMAQPEGGRKAFKQYLENQINYPVRALQQKVEGKVTVEFAVDVDGRLHDFRIVKGIGYGCDEEVIRAIKAGPSWSPSKKNAEPRREKVRLRYRFSLSKRK